VCFMSGFWASFFFVHKQPREQIFQEHKFLNTEGPKAYFLCSYAAKIWRFGRTYIIHQRLSISPVEVPSVAAKLNYCLYQSGLNGCKFFSKLKPIQQNSFFIQGLLLRLQTTPLQQRQSSRDHISMILLFSVYVISHHAS